MGDSREGLVGLVGLVCSLKSSLEVGPDVIGSVPSF